MIRRKEPCAMIRLWKRKKPGDVYCGQCRHYGSKLDPGNQGTSELCFAPSEVIDKSSYKEEILFSNTKCAIKNANNNCKDYKSPSTWSDEGA